MLKYKKEIKFLGVIYYIQPLKKKVSLFNKWIPLLVINTIQEKGCYAFVWLLLITTSAPTPTLGFNPHDPWGAPHLGLGHMLGKHVPFASSLVLYYYSSVI